jgi:hypothetical protein
VVQTSCDVRQPLDREVAVSRTTLARIRAAVLFGAPALLLLGFAYHPYVANPTDEAAVASAAADDTTRWGLAHLAVGVAYALMALAFVALRSYLREAGEERWSALGLPFAVLGSCLFIPLTGMEFALLAAAETGGDVLAAQEELTPWFIPVLVAAALSSAIGALCFATGVARSSVLARAVTRIVVAGFVVLALARFVPLGVTQVVVGLAAVTALWPIGHRVWAEAGSPSVADVPPASRAEAGS